MARGSTLLSKLYIQPLFKGKVFKPETMGDHFFFCDNECMECSYLNRKITVLSRVCRSAYMNKWKRLIKALWMAEHMYLNWSIIRNVMLFDCFMLGCDATAPPSCNATNSTDTSGLFFPFFPWSECQMCGRRCVCINASDKVLIIGWWNYETELNADQSQFLKVRLV